MNLSDLFLNKLKLPLMNATELIKDSRKAIREWGFLVFDRGSGS
jgi:hypothetical protein